MRRAAGMALTILLVLESLTSVFAQSSVSTRVDRRSSDRWQSNSSLGEPQKLFVVIEANAGKKTTDIEQIVKLGLEHLKKERRCEFDEVKIQPVSSSLYRGIRALFQGEMLESAGTEGGGSIRLLPGGNSSWEISTGGPFVRAKSLTVYFEKDEDGKVITLAAPQTFPTGRAADRDQPFRFHSPGAYLFSFGGDMIPTRCEIEVVSDAAGDAKTQVLKSNWPQENLYYLLSIERFSGDRRLLFETLKNNRVVGNGLKDVQTVESATISLATFIDPVDTGTSNWDDGGHYHVRIKKPDDKFPKRAWLLFPLNSEEAAAHSVRLKAACNLGAEDRRTLLGEIRSSGVAASDVKPLVPGAEPAWYEIPAEEGGGVNFSRVLDIGSVSGEQARNDPTFGLTIFEFNDEVILSVGNNYVQQHEHPRWADGLHRFAGKNAKSQ